jgi:hypothetical protein
MADLSLVIDPGGISGIRPGINLQVFPSGDSVADFQPYGTQAERLSNSALSSGGFENLYEFSTSFHLDKTEFNKLFSLLQWNQNERLNGRPWEVIIYNFVQPFTEMASSRSRYKVPGTSVITQTSLGLGLFQWEYWVAIQGSVVANYVQVGSKYQVSMGFQEGTKLTASMEPA